MQTNSCRHLRFNRICRLWIFLPVLDLHQPVSTILSLLRTFFLESFYGIILKLFSFDNLCCFHLVCQCHKYHYFPASGFLYKAVRFIMTVYQPTHVPSVIIFLICSLSNEGIADVQVTLDLHAVLYART